MKNNTKITYFLRILEIIVLVTCVILCIKMWIDVRDGVLADILEESNNGNSVLVFAMALSGDYMVNTRFIGIFLLVLGAFVLCIIPAMINWNKDGKIIDRAIIKTLGIMGILAFIASLILVLIFSISYKTNPLTFIQAAIELSFNYTFIK